MTKLPHSTYSICVKRLALLALFCASVGCATDPAPAPVPPNAVQRSLWVWSNLPATKGVSRQALWDEVSKYHFNTLYLQAQTLVYDDQPALRELINDAAERKLEVELLGGKHAWARQVEHGAALKVVDDLLVFVAQSGAPRPSGLHLNIEPHSLPEWQTDPNGIANALLDLLDAVVAKTAAAQLRLNFDMPNWYDDVLVTRHGTTRPLSQWLIDCCDRITLMDYRDTTAQQLQLAAEELAYSRKVGKVLVIGSETMCGLAGELTYCEEGQGALQATLTSLHQQLQGDNAYGGLAVHHWDALSALKL